MASFAAEHNVSTFNTEQLSENTKNETWQVQSNTSQITKNIFEMKNINEGEAEGNSQQES